MGTSQTLNLCYYKNKKRCGNVIPEQLIPTTISSNTKKYYNELGFDNKKGDIIYVSPTQLKKNSMVVETRLCDCCGKEYKGPHQSLIKSFNSFNKDVCPDCFASNKQIKGEQSNRRKQTNQIKYGANTPAENASIQEKIRNTNLDKYGVESTLLLDDVQDKIHHSIKVKYGVDNPMQSKMVQAKAKNTNLLKYGVENPLQNQEIKEKMFKTNLDRYGVKSTAQLPEVREKMLKTLYSHGNVPTSSQQKAVFEQIKKIYPNATVTLNSPMSLLFLDIEFELDEIKIDIEYDGQYWHQDKHKDFARDCIVQKYGYKVLRIKSNSLIPTDDELKNCIEELLTSNLNFKELFLADWE